MRLNDPFGRMQRRDEVGYASVKAALTQAQVRDRATAEGIIARTRRRVLLFLAAMVAILLPVLLIWPRLTPVLLALALLLGAVAINAMRQGRRHVQRYIDEELNHTQPGAE